MNKEKLFLKLPWTLRNLAVILLGAKNRVVRYGGGFKRYLKFLRKSEKYTLKQHRRYQTEQLLKLLKEAKSHTDYYAEKLEGFSDKDLKRISENLALDELPILEKEVLKGNVESFNNKSRKTADRSSTSGSTGSPLIVPHDRESIQRAHAFMRRQREWAGVPVFAKHVRLTGKQFATGSDQKYWVHNPAENQLLVSTYDLTEKTIPIILKRINDYSPELLEGYASAIQTLAESLPDDYSIPSLKAVITTAETLTPDTREVIENRFRVKLFDYYSASEGMPIILQCEEGSYHIRPESGIFEFLDEEGNEVELGETGELVITSFRQWKTPLIRYKTGDMATKAVRGVTCSCGRSLPIVKEILGRVEDLVLTKDGRKIGMFSYRSMKYIEGIEKSQIIQENPEQFTLRYIPNHRKKPEEVRVKTKEVFSRIIGYPVHIVVEPVNEIKVGSNGKFRSTLRNF